METYASLFDQPVPEIVIPDMVLRPYQSEAVGAIYQEWEQHTSTLLCLATGTGKTVVFTDVMKRWRGTGRILVLAHREELVYQAMSHAEKAGLSVGIEKGPLRARHEDVVISTIQTQCAARKCKACRGEGCPSCDGTGKRWRLEMFRPREFAMVIIDEGHHATAKTYRRVLKHYCQNEDIKVLIVTATPNRSDGVGLHNVCDSVAYEMRLQEAISAGWLCPIRQQFIEVEGLDLSKVGTKNGGDLKDGELEAAMLGGGGDEEKMLHAMAKPTLDKANGRPILFFAAGVNHAQKMTAAFNAYEGVRAECVIGTTDKALRKDSVDRYKSGETQVLVGVGVFTEGFDAPGTEVVAIGKPTLSETLYEQMIGRCTRPLPGTVDGPETATERRDAIASSNKPYSRIIDFVGNSGRHKLITTMDLLYGSDVDDIDLEWAHKVAREAEDGVDPVEALEIARQRREDHDKRVEEERERRRTEQETTDYYASRADYTSTDVDLFNKSRFDSFLDDYNPPPDGATAKQVKYLVKLGVKPETAMGYGKRQAGSVIDKLTSGTGADFRMPFGKHAGKVLSKVPRGYLSWAASNITDDKVLSNIKTYLSGHR